MATFVRETTYSFLHAPHVSALDLRVETDTPVSDFEKQISAGLAKASAYLMHEEFGLALSAYQELAGLLLHTVDPRIRPDIGRLETFRPPWLPELIEPLLGSAIRTLAAKTLPVSTIPRPVLNPNPDALPSSVKDAMNTWRMVGARSSPARETIAGLVERADLAASSGHVDDARARYRDAVTALPTTEAPLREGLMREVARASLAAASPTVATLGGEGVVGAMRTTSAMPVAASLPELAAVRRYSSSPGSIGLALGDRVVAIDLEKDPQTSLRQLYQQRVRSTDLPVITSYLHDRTQTAAYLPHIYFFVIPMAIGDSYTGLGSYALAESSYLGVLNYTYLNEPVEAVALWTRLAELYVAWGDHLYRAAGNDPSGYDAARAVYAKIVTPAGTIDASSPLYSDAKFAAVRTRVQAILGAPDPLALDENPRIIAAILGARQRLAQIGQALNYFGLTPDYVPPFSFEYLQNTARYLAQQAGRIGELYINFKSHAETEQLGRDQLDQQADLARASVQLEQLGVSEATAGLSVAQATSHYADVQAQNAVQARDGFAAVRWELLELSSLEAWSSAASMDEDDEVEQTISGFTYYNATDKRRSEVLYDLASRRTRISHDLEAARLNREVASAQAYRGVAQAQVQQAQARVAVARQRVAIAELQRRNAEANRDFVDGKEFSFRMWYELARVVRGLTQRYLDMATEAAFLMERAYVLETGRDLHRIRFDLSSSAATGLLAGELLLADIDSFTQDYLATSRARRAPGKQVISLADAYPTAFAALLGSGRCSFETGFAQFERGAPGAWLAKLRNVELVFVGITSAAGLQGTLRNIGISRVRRSDGSEIVVPAAADVLPLSQYEARSDALLFRFSPNELRVFENCGLATRWQLDLPLDANGFDYRQILDVQLVLYYDAFYDTTLEAQVRAALPAGGSASRAFSMALFFTDELFYLRNQGSAEIAFDAGLLAWSQTAPIRRRVVLRATGGAAVVAVLSFHIHSDEAAADLTVTTDGSGVADSATPGSPLAPLVGRTLYDRWTLRLDDLARAAVLADVQIFFEYDFTYRAA